MRPWGWFSRGANAESFKKKKNAGSSEKKVEPASSFTATNLQARTAGRSLPTTERLFT